MQNHERTRTIFGTGKPIKTFSPEEVWTQRIRGRRAWQQYLDHLEGKPVCTIKARKYCNPQGRISKTINGLESIPIKHKHREELCPGKDTRVILHIVVRWKALLLSWRRWVGSVWVALLVPFKFPAQCYSAEIKYL